MTPRRLHANGVPWLIWVEGRDWVCEGCGEAGRQPPYSNAREFARWAGDMKRGHARCGEEILVGANQVGHPLNPDRRER